MISKKVRMVGQGSTQDDPREARTTLAIAVACANNSRWSIRQPLALTNTTVSKLT
jgi:hypothetical protein